MKRVDPDGARERRDHWEKTAHALLTGAILHVLYAEEEKTLTRVATFLADPGRSIERSLRIMLTTNHVGSAEAPRAHPVVASIARAISSERPSPRFSPCLQRTWMKPPAEIDTFLR